jgi:hypothetical protein
MRRNSIPSQPPIRDIAAGQQLQLVAGAVGDFALSGHLFRIGGMYFHRAGFSTW